MPDSVVFGPGIPNTAACAGLNVQSMPTSSTHGKAYCRKHRMGQVFIFLCPTRCGTTAGFGNAVHSWAVLGPAPNSYFGAGRF